MTNIGLYKNHTTTVLLNKLSNTITKLKLNNTKLENNRVKSLINELKTRILSETQKLKFKYLFDRYTWI
jgi:hypothetical protein